MTTTFERDHPRIADGTFAQKLQTSPEVALAFSDTAFQVNDAFPIPQANDLEKIAALVDAVDAGANTGAAIAETFDLSDRQGPYYLDAAGYLGLVDVVSGVDVRTFELTSLGQQMLASDELGRVEILKTLVASTPAVQIYADGGEEAMLDFLSEAGLGDGTAARRGASATSWYQALTASQDFAGAIGDELVAARARSGMAAAHAREAAAARSMARAERPVKVCTNCFMQMPASGVCGC
jgi:hypothetical protein